MTATWSEERGFTLNSSFSLSFPFGISVDVSPGINWHKIGEIFTSMTAGLIPQNAIPPEGYTWIPETIAIVSNRAEANPTYGENYQVFSHVQYYYNHSNGRTYEENIYDVRRDGSQSVTYTWSRMAQE